MLNACNFFKSSCLFAVRVAAGNFKSCLAFSNLALALGNEYAANAYELDQILTNPKVTLHLFLFKNCVNIIKTYSLSRIVQSAKILDPRGTKLSLYPSQSCEMASLLPRASF